MAESSHAGPAPAPDTQGFEEPPPPPRPSVSCSRNDLASRQLQGVSPKSGSCPAPQMPLRLTVPSGSNLSVLVRPHADGSPGPGHAEVLFPAGSATPSQFPGLPSRSALYQQPDAGSPPPGVALTCLGLPQPAPPQQVTIQVQEPVDMLSSGPGPAGRGLSMSPGASQMPGPHRTSLMASFSYGHRPLSKQLSADSAEAHR